MVLTEPSPTERVVRRFPRMPWAVPVKIVLESRAGVEHTSWGCRVCLGVPRRLRVWPPVLYDTRDAHAKHVRDTHPYVPVRRVL